MTLHQHGRGGWVSKGGRVARLGGLVILGLVLAAGCSSKTKGLPGEGAGKVGGSEGNVGGSSLEQMQKGTLGSGTGGPLTDIHFEYNAYNIAAQDGSVL